MEKIKMIKWNNLNSMGKKVVSLIIVISALTIISLTIGLFSSLSLLESFRIVFGSVYVLFLPGFIISFIFFPKTKKFEEKNNEKGTIDFIERIALSFALSIAIVPLVIFYLNLIGIRINLVNSFLEILGILLVSILILYLKRNINHK